MTLKIAVIGAGPGGCMLARLLQQSNSEIAVTIFEGEDSINYRSQGGCLDLRTGTGLAAVKKAGLWNEFQKHARYDGESLLVTDKNLTTWLKRDGRKPGGEGKKQLQEAPEIDRAVLREMLVESLPPSCIRWGFKLLRVEETPSGLTLHFANGQTRTEFDLIVGCDGAFSKTRTLLTSEQPYYSGLGGWAMSILNAEATAPEVYKLVNRGSVFAYSNNSNISIQQMGDGSINVSAYGRYPLGYTKTCGFDVHNIDEVRVALKTQHHDWRPELLDAIEKANDTPAWRDLYQLPVGFTWSHKAGITLLGDAAHLMTPFAGIGVNTAFYDAMLLSDQISAYFAEASLAEHGDQVRKVRAMDSYVRNYEKDMFEHAHKGQELTEGSKNDMFFTPGAPRTSIQSWFFRHLSQQLPWWIRPPAKALVYSGFWMYKWFV